jgi:chromosome segregation ATPase
MHFHGQKHSSAFIHPKTQTANGTLMDNTQLAQMVTWLDEQHRRDREELTKLQQRVEAQTSTLQEQSRRIKSLEAQLSAARMQLSRFDQIEEAMQNMRNELTIMVSSQSDEISKTRRELEQSRMTDRESLSRAIAEVRKELGRINALEEETKIRKTEVQRLSELTIALRHDFNNLNKDIDERTRGLPYLVEQRNHDNRRIAQLQQENIELFKRLDAAASKLQSLEYKLQKVEGTIQPIPETVDNLKRTQTQFIESLKLADADRQRQMVEWQESLDAQFAAIEEQRKRFTEMMALKDEINRTLIELEKFREGIQREQEQTAALQRLAEERMKKELEMFQADNEKLWKKQLLDWQYRWDRQDRINASIADKFPGIQRQIERAEELLQFLWAILDEQSKVSLQSAQKWLAQIQKSAEARDAIYRKYKETEQPD